MGKKELNPATFSRVGEYDSFGVGKSNIPVHSLENSLIVFLIFPFVGSGSAINNVSPFISYTTT